ncbi:MAG: ATP-dependent 6-phosphofructokinase [Pseudomonadota bacterium]
MDTSIEALGPARIESPIKAHEFVEDDARVLYDISLKGIGPAPDTGEPPVSFIKAGPRSRIFFDPRKLKCALVTCGGLCPGINNVIRSVVLTLYHIYGVRNILGVKYGLQGFIPTYGHPVEELTPEKVVDIHMMGGTILGSSRGPQDVAEIVDALERMNIGILFMIGGDGTLRAAGRIAEEVKSRGTKIGIIGIPKTIDNDINLVSRSFGFNTAVSMATQAILAAHVEATGYPSGVGLVKLMGRHSGFIAVYAALATRDSNLVLIPEVNFDIDGPNGLLKWLESRLAHRGHAVIVAAEGAGQDYCRGEGVDESGNPRLGNIGRYLEGRIKTSFKENGLDLNLKYIDPSYIIRSVPANPDDSVYCGFLGQNAVHAGMAGKTGVFVGTINDEFVIIPLTLAGAGRKQVDPKGRLWQSVLETTGQPSLNSD